MDEETREKLARGLAKEKVQVVPELLTVEEAAVLLRIGRSRAYEWAANGTMPGVMRLGRSVRISRRALLAWIEDLVK